MGGYVAIASKQTVEAAPTNPAGTTSTAAKVMMGLAAAYTPRTGAKFIVIMSGDVINNSIGGGAQWQMRYGTGTAPANAAADTGTAAGRSQNFVAATSVNRAPFSRQCILTGLTGGTTYWFDLALQAVTAGTATLANITINIIEL